eukprot:c16085_g1_i1.p1 GENE.c16085_g1_i1~~c16085_g1_i1.p1  ORF type:complete len:693 (+),score=98.26 c16085_g1_i1:514-2592(+)
MSNLAFLWMSSGRLSGSIPTQIMALTNLFVIAFSNNRLSGTLPPTMFLTCPRLRFVFLNNNNIGGKLPTLNTSVTTCIVMSSNQLTGSIELASNNRSRLETLILHNNLLTGTIPSSISQISQLRVLSLFGNRLTGTLPPLRQHNNSLVLLFENFLSCRIPSISTDQHVHNARTLIAPGNMFPLDSFARLDAEWLYEWDRDSTHLFLPFPAPWVRLCTFVSIGIFIVLVLSVPVFRMNSVGSQTSSFRKRKQGQIPPVWTKLGYFCGAMVGMSAIHAVVLFSSANMFYCGDQLAHITLADADRIGPGLCLGVVVCGILHFALSLWGLRLLHGTNIRQPPPIKSLELVAMLLLEAELSAAYNAPPINDAPVVHVEPWTNVIPRRSALMAGWLVSLGILNVPTIVYTTIQALPANNVLNLSQWEASMLGHAIAPVLVVVSEVIVPWLCAFVVSKWDNDMETRRRLDLATAFVLLSHILVLSVLPILSEFALAQGCMQGSRLLWRPCTAEGNFDVLIPILNAVNVTVLHHSDVCTPSFGDANRCVRQVIRTVAQLNMNKIIWQALFSTIKIFAVFGSGLFTAHRRVTWKWARRILLLVPQTVSMKVMTLTALSWTVTGFMYGGVAPLVWGAVALGLVSQYLSLQVIRSVEIFRNVRIMSHHDTFRDIPVGIMASGIVIQGVLFVWFFVSAYPCTAS